MKTEENFGEFTNQPGSAGFPDVVLSKTSVRSKREVPVSVSSSSLFSFTKGRIDRNNNINSCVGGQSKIMINKHKKLSR